MEEEMLQTQPGGFYSSMEWWAGHRGSGSQTWKTYQEIGRSPVTINIRQMVTTGCDGLKEKTKKQNKTEGSKYKKSSKSTWGSK